MAPERSVPRDGSKARPSRRDLAALGGGAMLAVGATLSAWPFVDSLNPAAGAEAESLVHLDIRTLPDGRLLGGQWRTMRFYVFRRGPDDLAATERSWAEPRRGVPPIGRRTRAPAYTSNWYRSIVPAVMVVAGDCSFDGVPVMRHAGQKPAGRTILFCSRCGSTFDLAGRCLAGPAVDLDIPPHHYEAPDRLVIGEDPPGYERRA